MNKPCRTAMLCWITVASPVIASSTIVTLSEPKSLPSPFNYHTIDLQALVDNPNSGWIATGVQVDLLSTSEFFFHASLGTISEELTAPKPSVALNNPLEQWDTFVTTPLGFPNVLDDDATVAPPAIVAGPLGGPTSDPQQISAAWGLTPPNVVIPGAYTVARFTVASTSAAPFTLTPVGAPIARLKGTSFFKINDDIQPFDIFVYRVPEPRTFVLLISTALLRRARCRPVR